MGSNLERDIAEAEATGLPITSPDDPRVEWDDENGAYFLHGPNPKTILVFIGASLGPAYAKGVLQIKVDPAAVRVEKGQKLRWIIHDLAGQKDTTKIRIVPGKGWAFPPAPASTLEAERRPDGPGFVETRSGRIDTAPAEATTTVGGKERVRGKYTIELEFQENELSPILKATIDPDVVYNPPGF